MLENLKTKSDSLTKIILAILLGVDFFIIITYFLAAPLGLSLFFGTSDGVAYAERYSTLYILLFALPFWLPLEVNIGGLFVALMAIYTTCLIASWLLTPNLQTTIREMIMVSPSRILRNWMLSMPLISSMLLTAIMELQSFQESHGVPTGGITFTSPFETLTELAYSPVLEEIGFRVTPIGALIAVEAIMVWRVGRRTGHPVSLPRVLALSFLAPERARKFAGLKTIETHGILCGIGLAGWILILAMSTGFGFAHYLSGAGWEIGKVSTAFVAGLALSLVYWRYGAHAVMLLHWFFNYYSYVYQMASDTYANVFTNLLFVLDRVTIWLGVLGWLTLLIFVAFKVHLRTRKRI